MKTLVVEANVEHIDKVLDFVNTELQVHGFPTALVPDIDLAVEEIFVNISTYAYPLSGGDVTLHITVEREVALQFVDTGIPFNPLEVPPPDLDKPLLERDIGGLGIHFVKQVMDEAAYSYVDNRNILTLTKKGDA